MNELFPTGNATADRFTVEQIAARLRVAGIDDFRAPPAEPTSCCGRGCNGCVWEGYFAALGWWREDALERLSTTASARESTVGRDKPA